MHEQTSKISKLLQLDGSSRPKFYSELIEKLGRVEGLFVSQVNFAEHDTFQILCGNFGYILHLGTVALIKSNDLNNLLIPMWALTTIFYCSEKYESYGSLAAFLSLQLAIIFYLKQSQKRDIMIFNKIN